MKTVIGKLTVTAAELVEYLGMKLAGEGRIPYTTVCSHLELDGKILADDTRIDIAYRKMKEKDDCHV